MRLMAALFLALTAFSAEKPGVNPTELWALEFPGASPEAVFFDAASGALFVSLRAGASARVDRVSLGGRREKEAVARAEGAPGPLRAFDGALYWIAGDQVRSFGPSGNRIATKSVPEGHGGAVDIALGPSGQIYLGMGDGPVLRLEDGKTTVESKGGAVSGLFLLESTLYVLRGARLQLLKEGKRRMEDFCQDCRWLERTSAGRWLTVRGKEILEIAGTRHRVLLAPGKGIGRPAFVFRKDPKEDFFVLPFPGEGAVRAYRYNPIKGAAKRP
jgi:hypothetical protein